MFCFTIVSDDSPVRKRRQTIPLALSSDSDGETQLLNDDESTPFYKNGSPLRDISELIVLFKNILTNQSNIQCTPILINYY